jgi:hypothetical protein
MDKLHVWIYPEPGHMYRACCRGTSELGKTVNEAKEKLEKTTGVSQEDWDIYEMFSTINRDVLVCKNKEGGYIGTNVAGYKLLTIQTTKEQVFKDLAKALPSNDFYNRIDDSEVWDKEELVLLACLIEEHIKVEILDPGYKDPFSVDISYKDLVPDFIYI